MPAARDDYLLRMIQQAAAALRRLRERLRDGGAPDEVVREASAAIGTLLGPQRPLLDMLDAASAARIVGNEDTVRAWAELLQLHAEASHLAGDPDTAGRLRTRASALVDALSRNVQRPAP